jgi:NADH-quinone oxidoreductase subunit J
MSAGSLLFSVCAILCVAGALVTVTAKNPIRGAVGLLGAIIGIAGLFLKLRAEFLAAIQLIVYAGAVVVLFVFVLMLLGSAVTTAPPGPGKARFSRTFAGVLMGFVSLIGLSSILRQETEATPFPAASVGHGTVEAVGNLMFSRAVVVFELSTALLIVAVIGAIAVARGKQGVLRKKRVITNPRDMFVGALMERDAVRPLPSPDNNEEAAQ